MIARNYPAAISPWVVLAAFISWGLTIAATINMLGGTFDGRSCQTGCMQSLALASFAVAAAGVLIDYRRPHHMFTLLCRFSLLALILIYLTVFFIGVLLG